MFFKHKHIFYLLGLLNHVQICLNHEKRTIYSKDIVKFLKILARIDNLIKINLQQLLKKSLHSLLECCLLNLIY
jgi:hypothetical protein